MAVQPMESTMPRGRQQFRLQPIYGGPQQHFQQQQRQYAGVQGAYYEYPYTGYQNTYPNYAAPAPNPSYNPPTAEPYASENEGYIINGVWYPYQQPYNIPQDSQARAQRPGRRSGYPGYPADLRHGGMPDGFGGVVYGKNRGPHDPYQQPDVPILDRVRNQLEYYFSAKNLSNDSYMRGLMREDGYIPLSLLMEFPRMKVHKISPGLAVRAANESPHLKVMGIDYPSQGGRPRDYFIRTKHSWWKYVVNPESIPEEEKIEDDADELIVIDSSAPRQRAKQSLWPENSDARAEEDTKTDSGGQRLGSQFENLRLQNEDTMRQ